MISQPADVMHPVLLAIKRTKCVQVFIFGTSISRGVIQRKEACLSCLTGGTKKDIEKEKIPLSLFCSLPSYSKPITI